MVKENSIVAVGACDTKPDYDYADGVELRAYALQDGKEASVVVSGMDAAIALSAAMVKNGSSISIKAEAAKPFSVRLVGVKATAVSGASFEIDGNDTVIKSGSAEMVVTL